MLAFSVVTSMIFRVQELIFLGFYCQVIFLNNFASTYESTYLIISFDYLFHDNDHL